MAVRPVLQLGDPELRRVSREVPDPRAPEVAALVRDLADTLAHWRRTTGYGRAISAPQIGAALRVVFVDDGEAFALVNPRIVERSAETLVVWDACLSFLDTFCQVRRHARVRVAYQDLEGRERELAAEGERSELLQHELDHLDGILALDRMVAVASLCSRVEFEKRHRAGTPYAPGRGSSAGRSSIASPKL